MDKLIFGTDGWRDVIAETFTFANLSRATQAYANYLVSQKQNKTVVVGYDTRFLGSQFAHHAAQILAANGLRVFLSKNYLPTPALSYAVKYYQAGGGLMLTASHNPPEFQGFKLKGSYAGTATPDIYKTVSDNVDQLGKIKPFDQNKHQLEYFDIRYPYYDFLKLQVNLEVIKTLETPIYHEAVGGAGTGWLSEFFKYAGLPQTIIDLHPEPHPLFYGVNPEPLAINLGHAIATLEHEKQGIVICSDGDADRIGVVLAGGKFFNPHQIFAVLLDQLYRKGIKGNVVKTFTVSRIIERLSKARGLELKETPVGFKYIVDAMLEGNVMIGGEESGGIGIQGHIPERDSFLNGLLLLETMATTGKNLDVLFSDIENEVGWKHAYDRLDLHVRGNELKVAVMKALKNPLAEIAGRKIESVETLDGIKLNLSNNAWLMFRASGTEPVLRIYCEAASTEEVAYILESAHNFVKGFSE